MPIAPPPVQFDYVAKAKIGDQVKYMLRHNRRRPRPAKLFRVLHNRPQRRSMQVVEMCVRDQNQIDGRKIADSDTGLPEALQYEQPACKIRVNDYVFPADLQKKAGVPNE